MSPVVHTVKPTPTRESLCAPARTALFTELLNDNHDAWKVARKERAYSFCREFGHDHPLLPFGLLVLTTEPGKPQTFDFYSARGKHSLLTTYGDEVREAAQILMDREYIIALYTKSAIQHGQENWEHHLSFSGDQLTRRTTTLKHRAPLFDKIVGSTFNPLSSSPVGTGALSLPRYRAGLVISQHENEVPVVRCQISYPREIEMTFSSSRLCKGLDAITGEMVSFISDLNRRVETQRYLDEGNF